MNDSQDSQDLTIDELMAMQRAGIATSDDLDLKAQLIKADLGIDDSGDDSK